MWRLKKLKRKWPLVITGVALIAVILLWYFFNTFSNTSTSTAWDGSISASFGGGNGSELNPYLIENGSDLALLKKKLESDEATIFSDKHYKLSIGINLGDREFSINNEVPFEGTFDGDAYYIINGEITGNLFQTVEEGTIKNLNFRDCTFINSSERASGLLVGSSVNGIFENITAVIDFEVSNDNYVGALIGDDSYSHIRNIVLDFDYDVDSDLVSKVGSLLYKGDNTDIENVLIKEDNIISSRYVEDVDISESEVIEYTNVDDNEVESAIVDFNLITGVGFRFQISDGEIIVNKLSENTISDSLGVSSFVANDSGIDGDTLYINDLEADFNYYEGLNYVTSPSGALPTTENKSLYNENNLVAVQLIYSGTDPVGDLTGYVSLTEQQSKFVYYKYYPVVNGKVKIELIDNPFSNRPIDKGFNGWVNEGENGKIIFDVDTYKRYIEVDVTYSGSTPDNIVISLYASWVEAQVANKTVANSWADVFSGLNEKGFELLTIDLISHEFYDMVGYYVQEHVGFFGTYTGYNANGNYVNNVICWSSSCAYYVLLGNEDYDEEKTYYELVNGSMTLVDTSTLPLVFYNIENPYIDQSMAGFFNTVTLSRYDTYNDLYDASGNYLASGSCAAATCTYYSLLDITSVYDENANYYYFVTRDTNIIYLMGTINNTWGSAQNKPFTFTGVHNGVDYRNSYRWEIANTAVQIYDDTVIENLTIHNNAAGNNNNPVGYSDASGYLYGNWYNLKVGRGLKQYNNRRSFTGVFGGTTGTTGSASAPTEYSLIVESGFYSTVTVTGPMANTSSNQYINAYPVYGSDYDRIIGNNVNLDVYFVACGSWGGNIRSASSTDLSLNLIVKSGTFGSGRSGSTTGIYVGGRGYGNHYAPRAAKIEGGYIYNLIGGPLTVSSQAALNDTYIYVTGGSIDAITGGAGISATYGNRVISLTGGTVNYSVFGGSNGYNGQTQDGTLIGSSYIYVGGNSVVGNESYVSLNRTLWGAEAGSIFGSGNGRIGNQYLALGSADSSTIVIDGDATVLRNVYGGGNYGALGGNDLPGSSSTVSTTIKVFGGQVLGDIYGGGNQNGSGSDSKMTAIDIEMTDGTVGNVYGGSNLLGTIHGDINLNINGGTVNTNIYGGGKGQSTFASRNVVVEIGNNLVGPTVNGSVYGGSAFGSVNGTENNTTVTNFETDVVINNGIIRQSVYGGGEGNTTYTPWTLGNLTVTVNGGNIGFVYGGNNLSGIPNGTSPVYLNGGIIGEAYGGGNQSSVINTQIYLDGAVATYLFGGSNSAGNVETSTVSVTSGTVNSVFGGNNVGGVLNTSNVTISGGNILNEVYGGGNEIATSTTNLNLINSVNKIPYAYGGGRSANVTRTNVNENGASVENLFGGSNMSGTVLNSVITYNSGSTDNVYGGNNAGGITVNAHVTVGNGTIGNLYSGGNYVDSDTSVTTINNGTITNVFGGGNQAGISDTSLVFNGGEITNVYGGANTSGTVVDSIITVQNANAEIENLYGGNNIGGLTENPKIIVTNGNVESLFGGGNIAQTTKTDVSVSGGIIGVLYGGGNEAEVAEGTSVVLTGGSITNNAYGGGNFGTVGENTLVRAVGVTVGGSIYAGGNGATAIVHGNTNISLGGTTYIGNNNSIAPHSGSVFGGGNAAPTGEASLNNSISTVNIAGGKIYGNVYGGANTSVIYGTASVNIGIDTITDKTLPVDEIYIKGTTFGGGEANALGSETYDYSFISVTNGINVQIDGNSHEDFAMTGSIFGSGNASSTEGTSTITIKNYGSINNPQRNISIQRTDLLTIDNSAIVLSGATDRTNEYSDVLFTLSIISNLRLKNNSTLFLETGANLLRRWESLDSNGVYEAVTVDEDNQTVTQNTDNRVYMYEGINLNIANNESVTSYGNVYGMTFFGMYSYNYDDSLNLGIYSPEFEYGDTLDWGLMPNRGSYVLGAHKLNHYIEVDGFYSNFMDNLTSTNKIDYITPTPDDSNFYMWVIGEAVIEYTIDLVASKYSTLGITELTFLEFSNPNTSFQVLGFDAGGLNSDISLVDPSSIQKIAGTNEEANTVMGLTMESSNTGWLTTGETTFLTGDPNITGTRLYVGGNTTAVQSLLFYLYHSKNITSTGDLGNVEISIMVLTRIDALNVTAERIVINANISTALYQTNEYEGTMAPGRKYNIFAPEVTNISSESSISAYYSLYAEEANFYKPGYHRALVSNYVLPINTKITMIDFVNNAPVYYYHIINQNDYDNALDEFSQYGEASYRFSLFTKMGSAHSVGAYDDESMNGIYYNAGSEFAVEEFIFIVSFEDTVINTDELDNSLVIELRDDGDQTLISVLGIQRLGMNYNIYSNNPAVIEVEGEIDPSRIYNGTESDLTVITNFVNPKIGTNVIYDTRYFDSKLGINLTILDDEGNIVNGTSLLGVSFVIDGNRYYPNIDGTTRIKLADRVGNVSSWLTMDTGNSTLPSGAYTLSIESFGSPDGIYYGSTTSDYVHIPIEIINNVYGLNCIMDEHSVIFNAETGLNQLEESMISFDLKYDSELEAPNIRLKVFRRTYDTVYSNEYELVDFEDFVTDDLTESSNENEYVLISNPLADNIVELTTKTLLRTGTYKLTFYLYDGDVMIGEVNRYIIIK